MGRWKRSDGATAYTNLERGIGDLPARARWSRHRVNTAQCRGRTYCVRLSCSAECGGTRRGDGRASGSRVWWCVNGHSLACCIWVKHRGSTSHGHAGACHEEGTPGRRVLLEVAFLSRHGGGDKRATGEDCVWSIFCMKMRFLRAESRMDLLCAAISTKHECSQAAPATHWNVHIHTHRRLFFALDSALALSLVVGNDLRDCLFGTRPYLCSRRLHFAAWALSPRWRRW